MFVKSANDLAVNNVVTIFTVVVRGRLLVPVLYNMFLMRGLSMVLRQTCCGTKGQGNVGRQLFGHAPVRSRFHASVDLVRPKYAIGFAGPSRLFRRSGVAIQF